MHDDVAALAQELRDRNTPDAWTDGPAVIPFDHFAQVALDWIRSAGHLPLGHPANAAIWKAVHATLDDGRPATFRFRTGRKNPRNLYVQPDPEPDDADPSCGMLDTPAIARAAVEGINARIGGKTICTNCWFNDCRNCDGAPCAHLLHGHYEPERAHEQRKEAYEEGDLAGRAAAADEIRRILAADTEPSDLLRQIGAAFGITSSADLAEAADPGYLEDAVAEETADLAAELGRLKAAPRAVDLPPGTIVTDGIDRLEKRPGPERNGHNWLGGMNPAGRSQVFDYVVSTSDDGIDRMLANGATIERIGPEPRRAAP